MYLKKAEKESTKSDSDEEAHVTGSMVKSSKKKKLKKFDFVTEDGRHDRPIGLEGLDTWDGGKGTWGGRAKVFGTVPVWCMCTGRGVRDGLFLARKRVRVLCRLVRVYGFDKFGPWGLFKFTSCFSKRLGRASKVFSLAWADSTFAGRERNSSEVPTEESLVQ
nr:hypothetical protein [Tanacetum cinerariifolium]